MEICSKNSTALVELALAIGHAAFDAAISSYPDQRFTLWNGILVTASTPQASTNGREVEARPIVNLDSPSPFPPSTALSGAILRHMKVEEIAEAIAKLPPDQLARFRRWFTAFEAGRAEHAKELDSTATKLGRLAGRAFAELKKRGKEL